MVISIRGSLLLTIGLLFCILGCTRDRGHVLTPDHTSSPTEVHESVDVAKVSFEQNVLPILTAKCALVGCHVDGGPNTHGIDFTTYEYFLAGGEHGSVFIPGNAAESEIVEEVVEGKMPPPESGLPKLLEAEIQVLIDWVNQQEPRGDTVEHEHAEHEDGADMDADREGEHADDDADHGGMEGEHADDDGDHEDE